MTPREIEERLIAFGALALNGHFEYRQGFHSEGFFNPDMLYLSSILTESISRIIAEHYLEDSVNIVIGTSLVDLSLTQWSGLNLSKKSQGEDIIAIQPNLNTNPLNISPDYEQLIYRKHILVITNEYVPDKVQQIIRSVQTFGGEVMGISAVCTYTDRIHESSIMLPIWSLINIASWPTNECPLCKKGIALSPKP